MIEKDKICEYCKKPIKRGMKYRKRVNYPFGKKSTPRIGYYHDSCWKGDKTRPKHDSSAIRR